MSDEPDVKWVSKAVAATTAGVPLRTVQHRAKQHKVRTKGRLVALEDVLAQAGGRNDATHAADASAALALRQAEAARCRSTDALRGATRSTLGEA